MITLADAEILSYLNNHLNSDPASRKDLNRITDLVWTIMTLNFLEGDVWSGLHFTAPIWDILSITDLKGYRDDTGLFNWKLFENNVADKLHYDEIYGKAITENADGYTPTTNDTWSAPLAKVFTEITNQPTEVRGAIPMTDSL